MDQAKMPAVQEQSNRVTGESEMEVKKEIEDINMTQQRNHAKTENGTVSKTSTKDSPEMPLKRKVKQELSSNDDDVDESSSKKPRNDTQEAVENTQQNTENKQKNKESTQKTIESRQQNKESTQEYTESKQQNKESIQEYTDSKQQNKESIQEYTDSKQQNKESIQEYTDSKQQNKESSQKAIESKQQNNESTQKNTDSKQQNKASTQKNTESKQQLKESTHQNTESTKDSTTDIERETIKTSPTCMDIDEVYSLLVSNFPDNWSFPQICNYVTQSLEGVSVEMEPVLGDNKNELRLTLYSAEHRLSAENALQDKEVEGNKLKVIVEGDTVSTEETPSLDQDIWEKDPKGLYGMKPEYLSTLKITPPIGNWVHVTNFRCDKSELRDAFELAGNVVACSIINAKDKCGKIMYSHPLEAVQAISMLHGQVFYGLKLNVVMDKVANSQILLPKGLLSIGPGLGEDGSAVRQIIWEYERFLKGKATRINRSLFTAGNVNGIVVSQKTSYAVFEPKDKTDTPTPIPPVVSSSNPIPSVRPTIKPPRPSFRNMGPPVPQDPGHYRFPNSPMFRGPMPRGPMGPMGPIGPMGEMCSPGPFHCAFPPGPTRMPMPFGPRPPGSMHHAGPIHPLGPIHPPGPIRPPIPMVAPMSKSSPNWGKKMPQMIKCADSTTLKISNLPPTTSFPSLCEKLSTLAQVTSLEFTTPGCAVVKFASPSDAEKCLKNYPTIDLK